METQIGTLMKREILFVKAKVSLRYRSVSAYKCSLAAKGTPELYARRILAFAKRSTAQSLYPGKHYSSLARLLVSPYQSFGEEGTVQIAESSTGFIQFYDLDTNKSDRKVVIPNVESLDDYDDETRRKQPSGRLLFMQSYPSPHWLNHIGSKFDIDSEFFFRHLEFDQLRGIIVTSSCHHCHWLRRLFASA